MPIKKILTKQSIYEIYYPVNTKKTGNNMTDDKITTETLSISLPSQVIDDMDVKRKAEYKNRSEYIKDLILADLAQPKLV